MDVRGGIETICQCLAGYGRGTKEVIKDKGRLDPYCSKTIQSVRGTYQN